VNSPPCTPIPSIEYLPQLVSAVDVPPRVEQEAADLLEALESDQVCQGRKPVGIAAAAVYYTANNEPGLRLTQTELAEAADVATATIRTNIDTITEYLNDT
jgi:transcription initiation factor TFIIB